MRGRKPVTILLNCIAAKGPFIELANTNQWKELHRIEYNVPNQPTLMYDLFEFNLIQKQCLLDNDQLGWVLNLAIHNIVIRNIRNQNAVIQNLVFVGISRKLKSRHPKSRIMHSCFHILREKFYSYEFFENYEIFYTMKLISFSYFS